VSMRSISPDSPLWSPAVMTPCRLASRAEPSHHLRSQRNDLHVVPLAQLAGHRAEDARALRVALVGDQHHRRRVEHDVRPVGRRVSFAERTTTAFDLSPDFTSEPGSDFLTLTSTLSPTTRRAAREALARASSRRTRGSRRRSSPPSYPRLRTWIPAAASLSPIATPARKSSAYPTGSDHTTLLDHPHELHVLGLAHGRHSATSTLSPSATRCARRARAAPSAG
jgi:hypothetical protein